MPLRTAAAAAIAGAALLCIPASSALAGPNKNPPPPPPAASKAGPPDSPFSPPGTTMVAVKKDQDLRFGKLVMTSSTGVVVVPASGLPSYQGAVSIDTASSVGPARFEIKGPPNRSIQLNLTFPLSGSYGSSGTAKLDNLSVAADFMTGFKQNGTMVQVKLDGSGNNVITVGGQLTFARPDQYGSMNILFPISASVVK